MSEEANTTNLPLKDNGSLTIKLVLCMNTSPKTRCGKVTIGGPLLAVIRLLTCRIWVRFLHLAPLCTNPFENLSICIHSTFTHLHFHAAHSHDIIFNNDGDRISSACRRNRQGRKWARDEWDRQKWLHNGFWVVRKILPWSAETRKLQWTKQESFSQLTAIRLEGPQSKLRTDIPYELVDKLMEEINHKCPTQTMMARVTGPCVWKCQMWNAVLPFTS